MNRLVIYICIVFSTIVVESQYQANWTSLDARPLPLWYDEAKFGIFTHWGLYSVPQFAGEWFWYTWTIANNTDCKHFMETHYKPGTTYADFAAEFTAIDFDANHFANVVKKSGAKYFVLTTKHHEGFTLWPSPESWNWNAMDVGAGRDLVAEIKQAIVGHNIRFGTYYSLAEWFNPLYSMDKNDSTGQIIHDFPPVSTYYVDQVMYPQITDLINTYQPDILWTDGDWGRPEYWRSQEFLAWLYNESPVKENIVTNDRWGTNTACKHGGFFTCQDRFSPGVLQAHKWENADSVMTGSWGFDHSAYILEFVHTSQYAIFQLVKTIATGGNFLLNIAPDPKGYVLAIFEERLALIGAYVNAHSEAIFGTKPWIFQNETYIAALNSSVIWYTSQVRNSTGLDPYRLWNNQTQENTIIYAHIAQWPDDSKVNLTQLLPTAQTTVNLFSVNNAFIQLPYTQPWGANGGIQVDVSSVGLTKFPSKDAFGLKIEYAATQNVVPTIGI